MFPTSVIRNFWILRVRQQLKLNTKERRKGGRRERERKGRRERAGTGSLGLESPGIHLASGRARSGNWRLAWYHQTPGSISRGQEQRNVVASGSWKRKENNFPLQPSEGTQPFWYLDFSPRNPIGISDLQNYVIISLCCFGHLFMAICYRNNRKPVHLCLKLFAACKDFHCVLMLMFATLTQRTWGVCQG